MKKLLFVSLAAALTLASCSSDEPKNDPVVEGVTEGYIAFDLTGVAGLGGRALENGVYEDGTANESLVESINLYFFDAYGRQTRVVAQLTKDDWTQEEANGVTSIEDRYKTAAIELTKDPENANGTVEVLAVVNQDGFFAKDVKKADVLAHLSHDKTYAQADLAGSKPFSMSSSVYRDGSIVYDCTPISLNNVFTNATDAEDAPVEIYVDREMAKVEVPKVTTSVTLEGNDGLVYNGLDATASSNGLKVSIKGIGVTYIPTSSKLFKQHTGAWILDDALVSATNHRSFWADPVYTGKTENFLKVNNYEWAAGNQVAADAAGEYLNLSWNGQTALGEEGAHVYVTENTTGAFSHIMLLGQIVDANGKAVDMVRWAGKNYKADTFKTQYVNMLKYAGFFKKTGENAYASLDAADLVWYEGAEHQALVAAGTVKAYENTCKVVEGLDLYTKAADGTMSASNAAAANAELLLPNYIVWHYKSGMNYYYLPIKSGFGEDITNAAVNGIVRNHIYRVKVTSIAGLGTPVADPAEIIIPENPEDKAFYMAAAINVLQWRVVEGIYDFKTKK